jgi:hypothetical protein
MKGWPGVAELDAAGPLPELPEFIDRCEDAAAALPRGMDTGGNP